MNAIAVVMALSGLGSDDYDTREQSYKAVARAVRSDPEKFGPIVAEAGRLSASAEVSSRCARALVPHSKWLAEHYPTPGNLGWPRIDCALSVPFDAADFYTSSARRNLYSTGQYTGDYDTTEDRIERAALWLYVRMEIECGRMSVAEADKLFIAAWKFEIRCWWFRSIYGG